MARTIFLLGLLFLTQDGPLSAGSALQSKAILASLAQGRKQEQAGRFAEALDTFRLAAQQARQSGDSELEAWALVSSAACQGRLFQYRQATETAQQARDVALKVHANAPAAAASTDLAVIDSQLGDFPLAETEADTAIRLLQGSERKVSLARALCVKADVLGCEHGPNPQAEELYQRAVSAARGAGDEQLQGRIWDDLAVSLLLSGNTQSAQTALNAADALCLKIHDSDYLPIIQEHQAELALREKNYAAALRFIDAAFASPSPLFQINPPYYPIHVRGEILLGLGRTDAALAEFRRAVDAADQWREGALPGDITATQTVVLLNDTYRDFAELAARLAFERHDAALSREAFEALARNRAASLRERLLANFSRSNTLPPRYFELLAALQAAQARITLAKPSNEDRAKLNAIRVELDDVENEMGLEPGNLSSLLENFSHKNSLSGIQLELSGTQALLSFCLGKTNSFLWAVIGDRVNLYELPPAREIEDGLQAFAEAIRDDKDARALGRSLSGELFGGVGPEIRRKREWLITPDGVLLSGFPFAALPAPSAPDSSATLACMHTLRLLPSELLLVSKPTPSPANYFVGVGDPIYNLADARRQRGKTASHAPVSLALARLAGSGREVQSSAALSGAAQTQVLVGADATGEELRRALARTPRVLHFAVHVVSPKAHPEQAALALSLGRDNVPELLTPEVVASFRVPGTLVIMSGCASEQGQILPSAGLIGLARAWLLAGAAGVIVSAWPTPDDSDRFFASFYSHLRADGPGSGTLIQRAAAALAQAQVQMQRTGGYRSLPSFWAAYSLISKE